MDVVHSMKLRYLGSRSEKVGECKCQQNGARNANQTETGRMPRRMNRGDPVQSGEASGEKKNDQVKEGTGFSPVFFLFRMIQLLNIYNRQIVTTNYNAQTKMINRNKFEKNRLVL